MKKIIITLLFGVLLSTSCSDEELRNNGSNVKEGKPALVSLKMDMATMGSGKTRAMSPDKEKKIESLRVMIFNNQGDILTNRKYTGDLGTSLDVETFSGSNCKICVVANVADGLDSRLEAIYTYLELEDATVAALELGFGLDDNPLMMTGYAEDVNIQDGENVLPDAIELKFLAAKVTLKVRDNTPDGQEVTVLGWDVVDAPTSSYLFPATGDVNPDPEINNDAKYWLTTREDNPFDEIDMENKSVTQELYLFENRRGGRVDRALPVEEAQYPKMAFDDEDDKGKAWFKPKRATAILISAMHKFGSETKQVSAYIYLGEDNHSNYDIVRGNHYTFNVTVNGLNDIDVDSNVEYYVGDFRVDHGDNLGMDCHPDFRPMRIHASEGVATMEIVDADGRTYDEDGFDATWLKISPLNLMFHQVKQEAPHDEWQQQTGEPGSFVRAKYIPHKSVRAALADKGGWNTIPEGQEDDDAMTYADATYRMCYKITDIPFSGVTVTNNTLYVYADDFFKNGDDPDGTRSATIRFSFYKGGNGSRPEVKDYIVTQTGYLDLFPKGDQTAAMINTYPVIFNETALRIVGKRTFVFERIEEAALALNPGIDPSLQRTTTMQWGYSGTVVYDGPSGHKTEHGQLMTAHTVYTDVEVNWEGINSRLPRNFGKTYREMYGNGKTGGTGPIPNYTKPTVAPYFYPDPAENIYHPIYKSSASRYCHEKNRDMNGDGIIDESEANWFMPTHNDLKNQNVRYPDNNQVYSTSSEEQTRPEQLIYRVLLKEGGSSAGGPVHGTKTDLLRVRCIREHKVWAY